MKKFPLFLSSCFLTLNILAQFSTKIEIMYSQYVQDSFEIYISTPPSFTSNSSYNIVYYCDANLKSGHHLQSFISTNKYNKSLSQVIFVGIGHIGNYHVLRRRDFILPETNGKDTIGRDKNYGQIEKFYSFLKYELIASIDQRFKVNPNGNSIIGHSLGGLLVFFCLFQADNLFARYFALSPALWIDNYSIYKFNKLKDGFTQKKYLFFAAGSKETVNKILHGTNEAKEFFDKKTYMNLTYEYKILKGETHNSGVPISLKEILNNKL